MQAKVINFNDKFNQFSQHWSPRVIAQLNDYQFKLVKVAGEFVWHKHLDTDKVFIVIEGTLHIAFRDKDITLQAGEMVVVPKGVEHKPMANDECKIMIIEPQGVVNTGEVESDLTGLNDQWI
ncbi:MAG: cupin domain-containing protein [Shewanella psychromarinicola]|uniref:cupin domain-containing protein n=1 Tax=Shewanella psychromarinicola TaxID=2487742 RepID=UPI0030022CD2